MKQADLSALKTEQLVELFTTIAVAQDEALLGGRIATFNRLYDRMENVPIELKNRDGDQRRALLQLYDYNNIQVRLKAAMYTLAVEPELARHQLQVIADSNWFPQAGDAGMSLWNLERGVFKPT